MTGEMSQSEVTRQNYPLLFALQASLKRRGIRSHPRAFDQYQGPYLQVPDRCKVWYAPADYEAFVIEGWGGRFEIEGADFVTPADDRNYEFGTYSLRRASRRIAALAGK